MVGAGCVLVLAMGAAEPAGPLTLPAPERARAKQAATSKPVPRPRVAPPRSVTKPAAPSQRGLAESLGLEPRPDGGYDYTGKKSERFDATIRRDGVVEFELDPSVDLNVEGICVAAICSVRKPKTRREQRRRKAAVAVVALLAEAAIGRFSTGTVNYGHPTAAPINWTPFEMPPFHLATVQGRYGHLPTPAASMQEFMDRTYELRVEMALTAGLDDLEAARKRLPSTLVQLWSDDTRSPAERRAAVLELWADLDHAGVHADPVVAGDRRLEERRRESIAAARATIRSFVRRHAPEGSPQAFTAAELDAVPGAVPFDPY
jgi:hypothetical protein